MNRHDQIQHVMNILCDNIDVQIGPDEAEQILKELEAVGIIGQIKTIDQMEYDALRASLARNYWNVNEVSKELGIGRATIYRKVKEYGLDREISNPKGGR